MKSDVQEIDVNRMIRSAIWVIIIHALIPLFWVILFMFILPRFSLVFSEMNAPLPLLTQIAFKICSFFSHFWYLCLLVFLWILAADGAVYFLLLRRSSKIYAFFYSLAVVLSESALTVLYIIALFLPMVKTINALKG
jgi:type II secretory pathway component PulF